MSSAPPEGAFSFPEHELPILQVLVCEVIGEDAVRVEFGREPAQLWHGRRGHREDLAPVRPRLVPGDRRLDLGYRRLDRGLVAHPGEMECDAVALVGHARRQVVGGDRTDLGDEQDGRQPRAERVHGAYGRRTVLARDEELRLELLALARCELQPEVWQPGMPG